MMTVEESESEIARLIRKKIDDALEKAALVIEVIHDDAEPWQDRHLLRSAAAAVRALKGQPLS